MPLKKIKNVKKNFFKKLYKYKNSNEKFRCDETFLNSKLTILN